jgi:transglutaminase-like putative cysteine protease
MATKRPTSPVLARTQALWLLACAVLTLVPDVEHAPVWLTAAAAVALAWRAAIWWRRAALPPRWLLSFLVAAGSVGVFLTYRQFFGKDPGIALLILFLALKLLEMRRVRDGLAVVFLCYFLLLTHFLNEQGLDVAGLTLAALVVITAALASLAHAGQSVVAYLRLSVLMLAQAAPFMLVLFLLFPRVQGPLWGMPADAYSGMSGLSDSMSPGSISNLSLSGEIAFRARFEGEIPPKQLLYWRGPVLRLYDGRTWRAGAQQEKVSLPDTAPGETLRYEVTLEPHNKHWLFALEMPAVPPPGAIVSREHQVLSKTPVRSRLRYEMQSRPGFVPGADESDATLHTHLNLPTNNPRTRALAEQWRREMGQKPVQKAGQDEAVIRRMLDHFRQESFFYTLTPPLLGEDGIDQFLFETRRGFCEHYASAFVFAMRAAGIPARVVTGYQGGERNPVDGYLIVRQSDAHAWAEAWLEGRGWVRIDPTAAVAPSRIEAGLASAVPAGEPLPFLVRADLSWLRQLRFRWEAVTNTWNQWVLGYDPLRQREVLSRLGMREPDWKAMTAVMAALCGVLLLGLTVWALHKRVRLDPTVRDWNRLSRKLARIGLARKNWEGPADYAHRVAQAHPELAAPLSAITTLYIALRYGKLGGKEPRQKLRGLIADLKIATER